MTRANSVLTSSHIWRERVPLAFTVTGRWREGANGSANSTQWAYSAACRLSAVIGQGRIQDFRPLTESSTAEAARTVLDIAPIPQMHTIRYTPVDRLKMDAKTDNNEPKTRVSRFTLTFSKVT